MTALLFILPVVCFSQVTLSTNEKDEFTGSTKKSTDYSKNVFRAEKTAGSLYINVNRVDSLSYIGIIVTEDLGCLSEYDSKLMIKLVDGTIIESAQLTDTDCDSDFASAGFVAVKKEEMNLPDPYKIVNENNAKLATTKIEKIRVYGSKSYNDYIPNPKFKEFEAATVLMKHFEAVK